MNILYPAKITYDDKDERYLVEFLDFSEAFTEGETLEEALFNAAEVLTLTLEGRIDENMEIPVPSKCEKGIYMITPSARVQAALLIKQAKIGHTTAKLARAMQTSWPAISRLEDPHHWPSLRQLEKLIAVTGNKLVLSIEPFSKSCNPAKRRIGSRS
jgi:antitoxin HicB